MKLAHALMGWLTQNLQFLGIAPVSFVYLILDFFPQVSLVKAIVSTPAFLMLWAAFYFLDLIAFGLLYHSSFAAMSQRLGAPHLAVLALQLLSTLGVYSILQNFTLNFAGQKVINLEQLVTGFRRRALQAAAARKAQMEREFARRIGDALREIYCDNTQALTEDYAQIMRLAALKQDQFEPDLQAYATSEGLKRELLLTDLAMRIPLTDIESARRLLVKRKRRT